MRIILKLSYITYSILHIPKAIEFCTNSSTMRFIHINEYEYMNNYAQ